MNSNKQFYRYLANLAKERSNHNRNHASHIDHNDSGHVQELAWNHIEDTTETFRTVSESLLKQLDDPLATAIQPETHQLSVEC